MLRTFYLVCHPLLIEEIQFHLSRWRKLEPLQKIIRPIGNFIRIPNKFVRNSTKFSKKQCIINYTNFVSLICESIQIFSLEYFQTIYSRLFWYTWREAKICLPPRYFFSPLPSFLIVFGNPLLLLLLYQKFYIAPFAKVYESFCTETWLPVHTSERIYIPSISKNII